MQAQGKTHIITLSRAELGITPIGITVVFGS
jgi:hypothetical protein